MLERKITQYHAYRSATGFTGPGKVALMLHPFLGTDREQVRKLAALGVTNLCCLIDFCLPPDQVLAGLEELTKLKDGHATQRAASGNSRTTRRNAPVKSALSPKHIVVVGSGLVAQYLVRALITGDPTLAVSTIGDEPAFDRTQLPTLLDASRSTDEIRLPQHGAFIQGRVVAIDRAARLVKVALPSGGFDEVLYDYLVLATGAESIRPEIDGAHCAHSLNSLEDIEAIQRTQPRNVAILGGGVLGIEAAYSLAKSGATVSVIHRGPRIMERQLDAESARELQADLESQGIQFHLEARALGIDTTGVRLDSGHVAAGVVLFCIGTTARDQLARSAGLATDNGVTVDDAMRTADPRILAIGDCARHRGARSGLLSQGYAQAAVALATLNGVATAPPSFIASTKPKISPSVFSVGDTQGKQPIRHQTADGNRILWRDNTGCVAGAVVFGPWQSIARLIDTIRRRTPVPAWRWLAFRLTGELWPLTRDNPTHWPADTIVCQCRGITRGMVDTELREFQRVVAELREFEQEFNAPGETMPERLDTTDGNPNIRVLSLLTGAGQSCGDCQRLLAPLLGQKAVAVRHSRLLGATAASATVLALLLLIFSAPSRNSFTDHWDSLWRNAVAEQVTGYTLLTLLVFLGFLALRKRTWPALLGSIETWRLVHTIAGLAAVLTLIAHTGGHFGNGLVLCLSTVFVAASLSGGIYSLQIAREHQLGNVNLRSMLNWVHVITLWLMPVLLVFHIAQVYLW